LTLEALLEAVVAVLAAADPVGVVPEDNLVTLVRIKVIDQLRRFHFIDQQAVGTQGMVLPVLGRRFVPTRTVSPIPR
jgi:hypothetical protein